MSRDHPRMPAPVTAAVVASSTARFSKQNELLSPTSAAVVFAAEQRAAKPGHVTTGSLRVIGVGLWKPKLAHAAINTELLFP
jgi:hypothetical protein